MVEGLGLRGQGSEFGLERVGLRVGGFGFSVKKVVRGKKRFFCFGFRVSGSGVWSTGFGV